MFSYFSRSIVRKINAIILSIISLGLICFAIVIATTNYRGIVLELQEKASNTLQLAKISLVEQIWTMNQVGLDDIRNAILLDRDVVAIRVRDETEEVLTTRFREEYEGNEFEELKHRSNLQYQEAKVVKKDETIGDIHIVMSNEKALASVKETSFMIAGFTLTLIVILGGVISYFGLRFLKWPVNALQKSAVALAGGNLDEAIDTSRPDELGVLARSFADMRDSIRLKISDLQRLNQTSEHLANVFKREEAFNSVLDTITQKVNSNCAALYLKNENDVFELIAQVSKENTSEVLPGEFKLGEGIPGKVAEEEKTILGKKDENESTTSLLAIPLIEEKQVNGVMVFANSLQNLNYEETDKEFVETVSRIATATLSRIKMMDVIAEHNRTLEQKVLERTAAIRDLMDNTGQGFLSFGSDYKIHAEYSKACQTFFNGSIWNLDALETVFKGFDADKINSIKELFDMLFNNETEFDLIKEMIPSEHEIDGRILSLDYKVISPVDNSSPTKIMVILTDVTKEKQLAEKVKVEEERKTIIVKIALDKDGFIQFLRELEALFSSIYTNLDQKDISSIDTDDLFRSFHTLKGGCGIYGFKVIAQSAHEIESGLEDIRSGKAQIDKEQVNEIRDQTQALEKTLHQYLTDLNDILPPEERNVKSRYFRVAEEKIQRLEEFMLSFIGREHINKIKEEIDFLCRQPLAAVFRKYANSAEELSTRMNKEVRVDLIGSQLEVCHRRFEPLFGTLVHLVRNSVDHGLESPDIRSMMGKAETGNLTIEAERKNGQLVLRISDDGAGIDPSRIKQIAVDKGLVDEQKAENFEENEIIDLIFAPGFSTHDEVTNISGRGVGMDAVKNAVEELNGKIDVITQLDQGTTFELSFPE